MVLQPGRGGGKRLSPLKAMTERATPSSWPAKALGCDTRLREVPRSLRFVYFDRCAMRAHRVRWQASHVRLSETMAGAASEVQKPTGRPMMVRHSTQAAIACSAISRKHAMR